MEDFVERILKHVGWNVDGFKGFQNMLLNVTSILHAFGKAKPIRNVTNMLPIAEIMHGSADGCKPLEFLQTCYTRFLSGTQVDLRSLRGTERSPC